MPQFPTNTPTFTVKTDLVDDIMAAHVNMLQEEVRAIAQVIGTGVDANDPRTPASGGSGSTLHSRLRHVESTKEPAGTAAAILGGAFSMGGAGGNRVDFNGEDYFQARRVSDGAAMDLWLNWFGGGRVIAHALYSNSFYNEGTSNANHVHSRNGMYAVGTMEANYLYSRGGVSAASHHARGGASVFDSSGANSWGDAQVRIGATGGAGNCILSTWALNTASVLKWFAGNSYWEFLNSTGDPANGYHGVRAAYFQTASSLRFKENIEDLPEELGLDTIMQLRPVSFDLKNKWASNVLPNDDPASPQPIQSPGSIKDEETPNLGLIAEWTEPILPHVISYDDADASPLSIDYSAIVPSLIKGMQQQQRTIERLEERLAALEATE